MKETIKITYTGDITCDMPLLRASKNREGAYDFSEVFSKLGNTFKRSDIVVGNLETVCGGAQVGFQSRHLCYNTPDEFIKELAKNNVGFVSTANNHCLDQGIEGLVRTLDLLDENSIAHSGTYRSKKERDKTPIIEVDGRKIAMLSYTYSTNESNTGIVLNAENDFHVGLLKQQSDKTPNMSLLKKIAFKILGGKGRQFVKRIISRIKIALGLPFMTESKDEITVGDTDNPYLDRVKTDILRAKEEADYVAALIHAGGQFNEFPGEYCEFITDFLAKCGVDLIVENHPHIVQKISTINNCPAAFSLGGLNLSCSSDYVLHDYLPEYSIALNQYISSNSVEYTFSMFKNIESDDGHIVVWPLAELYEVCGEDEKQKIIKEAAVIYKRVTGKEADRFMPAEEYALEI